MKIYILADMEGISGIGMAEQARKGSSPYEEGRKLMMADMNTAIDAVFAAGAREVVTCDTHAGGGQIRIEEMDSRSLYETPCGGRLMPSLDESFDGVILLGQHARAGTLNGFLDHTVDSKAWFEYRINERVVGEIGIEAAYTGHYDVPVIMVSGDDAAAMEAGELLGEVECAVVKWGIGRNRAKCLPPPQAHELIRGAVSRALHSVDRFKPYKPSLPATIQLTFYRSDMADALASKPGVHRVDARTVSREVHSFLDVCRW